MKLSEFQNEVSRHVDTAGTQINVAETKRVLAVAFDVLLKLDGAELVDVVAKGLAQAKKQREQMMGHQKAGGSAGMTAVRTSSKCRGRKSQGTSHSPI